MKQLYFLSLLFFCFVINAQSTRIISAKVVDNFNKPIAAVNVKDQQTKKGTSTDANGNFTIEVTNSKETTLRFSHIAYKTLSISVNILQSTNLVTLFDKEDQLADVVIAKRKIDNPAEVISILSEDFISKNEIISFEQAADYIPGLEIYAQTANLPNYAIRGITDETITPSANSRVSVFVDGLFKSKPNGSLRSVFDVETLEVTKGPQVDKYGKVTQAGAINLIQNKAQNNTSGKLSFGAGNFDEKYINGYFNTPIVKDKLFFRVSGLHQFRKGYVENTGEGADFNSTNTFALRTAFKYHFTDNTTLDVIANYQEDSPTTIGFKSIIIPQRDGNKDRFSGVELERGDELGLERYQRGVTALFNHHWSNWTLHANAAYEKFRSNEFLEIDGSPAPAALIQDLADGEVISTGWYLDYKGKKISSKIGMNLQSDYSKQNIALDLNEQSSFFILTGRPQETIQNGQINLQEQFLSPTEFLGLLFLLEQSGDLTLDQREQLTPLVAILGNSSLFTSVIDSQHNTSQNYSSDVYGNFAYNITSKLNIDAALRLTHDYIEGSTRVAPNEQATILPRPLGLLTGAFPNNVSPLTNGVLQVNRNYLSLTGSLAVDYEISNDVNVFATVARGRRPQALNYFSDDFRITNDEIVWNYELGLKSFMFDNKLSFNSSIYLLKFINFNTPVSDNIDNQTGQLNFNRDDTGKATSLGVEFDFNYFLNSETSIFGNYNYVDATIDNKDVNGKTSKFAGNQIRLTPKHAFTTGFHWQKEFAKDWQVYVRPNFSFKSEVFFTSANDERLRQHSYGLLNFRTGVVLKKNYELSFFMRNVLDREYINDAGNSGNQFSIPTTIAGAPRIFGWRLTASF